jgi:hypothetical protein
VRHEGGFGAPIRLVDGRASVVVDAPAAVAWFRGASEVKSGESCSNYTRDISDGDTLEVAGCVVGTGDDRRVEPCGDGRVVITDDVAAVVEDARRQSKESLRFLGLFIPLFLAVAGALITTGPRRRPGRS